METNYRVALAQMLVEGGRPEANLERAGRRIAEAAEAGCRLIVLPEALDLGWTHPCAQRLAEPIPGGRSWHALASEARRRRIFVCAGLVEREGTQVFNSAVLISPDGALLLKHRKINELDIAWGLYGQGTRIEVCPTELGTIGLMICADGFARERFVGRSLGHLGAQMILSPSAWAVSADYDQEKVPYGQGWRTSYAPLSRQFSTWIIAVSNVGNLTEGPWAGMKCIGCSMVFDPAGREVLSGPYGEEAEALMFVDLKPTPKPRTFNDLSS